MCDGFVGIQSGEQCVTSHRGEFYSVWSCSKVKKKWKCFKKWSGNHRHKHTWFTQNILPEWWDWRAAWMLISEDVAGVHVTGSRRQVNDGRREKTTTRKLSILIDSDWDSKDRVRHRHVRNGIRIILGCVFHVNQQGVIIYGETLVSSLIAFTTDWFNHTLYFYMYTIFLSYIQMGEWSVSFYGQKLLF